MCIVVAGTLCRWCYYHDYYSALGHCASMYYSGATTTIVLQGTPTPPAGALIVIELSAPRSRSRAVGFHLGELELLILCWTIYFLQCLL